jgi:predicted RNA-binding Zn ribbon-like protein
MGMTDVNRSTVEEHAGVPQATVPATGGRASAPGRLELVRQLVNTFDVDTRSDQLTDPERLGAWLSERGLLRGGERLGRADLHRAVEVREALRALLAANAGQPLEPGALEVLNRAARTARLAVRFDGGGRAGLEPEPDGLESAFGRLFGIVHVAMVDGTWERLKACRNPECAFAFYDHSKNRSGRWCTMDVCGNAMKARAYRRRRAAKQPPAGD